MSKKVKVSPGKTTAIVRVTIGRGRRAVTVDVEVDVIFDDISMYRPGTTHELVREYIEDSVAAGFIGFKAQNLKTKVTEYKAWKKARGA